MNVLFLFIDGIGLGDRTQKNPLVDNQWSVFSKLTNDQGLHRYSDEFINDQISFRHLDANLGVQGLPQSGTGQASLFSGHNASKIINRHFGPFPHSKTRFLLEEESLFHKALAKGYHPHFINAYPDIFFKKMQARNRWTCTTLMAVSSGQRLNRLSDIKEGHSITAEITQEAWRSQLDLEVPRISPEIAGDRILKASDKFDLVMFEYYLTDKAGHSKNRNSSEQILSVLNRFLDHILTGKDENTALVICSDHGNLEDLSVKTHTRNKVPLIISGPSLPSIKKAQSIMDVPGIIIDLLEEG